VGRSSEGFSQLKDYLNRLGVVKKAELRAQTGSVILSYDPLRIKGERLVELLKQELDRVNGVAGYGLCDVKGADNRSPGSAPLLAQLLNVIALSAFMAYVVVKRLVFKTRVSEKPFSLTGVVVTIGAFPLLKRAWEDMGEGKRIGLFPFLTAACGLALITGEALAAFEIIWILAIGMLLEGYVTERAKRAIQDILEVTPERAVVLVKGREEERAVSELQAGNTVVVRIGKRIPVDGVVLTGEALVDESHITGRSQPELRQPGSWVYAGTVVAQGSLHIRADQLGEDTYLCRVTRLVEESLAKRGEVEKEADILAARLTRIGVAATLATLILTRSLARSFSVMLVMACPCATVLAASTAVTAAIANGARRHILIKGGLYLEQMSRVDTVCFDKTGTVTTDMPQVVEVLPRQNSRDILGLAAGAEAKSDHPLAKALVQSARSRNVKIKEGKGHEEFIGQGVRFSVNSTTVTVGNRRFMESEGIGISAFEKRATKQMASGRTVLFVADRGKVRGIISLANAVRPGAQDVLKRLREDGVARMSLISGDGEPIVKTISSTLGFDDHKAELLPDGKARYVEKLSQKGRKILMVGDGVNDALAISKATVGIAMGGGGSELAVEAADIALVKDDLEGLVVLRGLSRQALRTINQNFWMANLTNAVGILVGFFGWLPPVTAGILHIGHTLAIMVNSSRLLKWEPPDMGIAPGRPAL
jgi:cation-transporting P-type ATPase C